MKPSRPTSKIAALTRADAPSLSPQGARRLAAAQQRIRTAQDLGPRQTANAALMSLLSALKINPSQEIADDVAGYVLAKVRELYEEAAPS